MFSKSKKSGFHPTRKHVGFSPQIYNYFDKLNPHVLFVIQDALSYKNIDELYYLLETQQDDSIDKKELEDHFKKALDKLDILYEDE